MWTLFFLIIAGVVVAQNLKNLRHENERLAKRIADLHLEIDALRRAFLSRIEVLEGSGVAPTATPEAEPLPQSAPQEAATETPVWVAPPEIAETPETELPPSIPEPEPFDAPYVPAEVPVLSAPSKTRSGIEWERLIGVRGAAILGAIVLGLAAMLFLQYSIEHGLIPPIVRVAIGLIVGAGAMAGSEVLRKRGYATTANALAGGGAIVLYASVWASRSLYDLIGTGMAFGLMALITAACGLLSWRNSAREIAVLGLIGGFATPLVISSGQDNPIGLFGYLLLLNSALFLLARERGWPLLPLLGLGATTFYQAGWIMTQMGAERTFLGLSVLGLFAVFFAVSGKFGAAKDKDSEQGGLWQLVQIGGILLPFTIALYFASQAELSEHLYPIAGLLVLLCGAALWLDRVDSFPALPLSSAAASVAIYFVWVGQTTFDAVLSWEAIGIALALALLFHVFEEPFLRVKQAATNFPLSPAMLACGGLLLSVTAMPFKSFPPSYWPWLLGAVVLAALLVRQAWLREASVPLLAAAVLLGSSQGFSLLGFNVAKAPDHTLRYVAALLVLAAFHVLALRLTKLRHSANFAAASAALVLLVLNVPLVTENKIDDLLYLGAATAFALLAAFAATRLPSGGIYLAATALAAASHTMRVISSSAPSDDVSLVPVLLLLFVSAALFTFWPLVIGGQFLTLRLTTYGAALAGPLWFLVVTITWDHLWGDEMIGIAPLVLGALSLAAALRLRQQLLAADPARLRGLAWFAGIALSFVSIAIPMQLEKEWITIGWAVQAFALLQLWKRLDHPGLKYFALMLSAFSVARLILNPEIFEYYARSGRPWINWMTYGYLVPAAALVGSGMVLSKLEVARARSKEMFYRNGHPLGSIFCFSSAIIVVFAWINLTIFDAFSDGRAIELTLERLPARDLTLSAAWAIFAIGLLALAFRTNTQALRWTSLAFLLLTIGKVFLYDLGELEDLYRVASLVGLAGSLLLVSIAYQRFVFGRGNVEEKE